MKITRIGMDRTQDIDTEIIHVQVGSRTYRLGEGLNRELVINKVESNDDNDFNIEIKPICSNEIKIK